MAKIIVPPFGSVFNSGPYTVIVPGGEYADLDAFLAAANRASQEQQHGAVIFEKSDRVPLAITIRQKETTYLVSNPKEAEDGKR